NFAARLFQAALSRGWIAAYVELSDQVALYEFHQVFAQIVEKMYIPEQISTSPALSIPPCGLIGVLDAHFKRIREAIGLGPGADIPGSARNDVLARINTVLHTARIYGDFASAIRTYYTARIDDNREAASLVEKWFRAESDVRMRGFFKPISKLTAKGHLRDL